MSYDLLESGAIGTELSLVELKRDWAQITRHDTLIALSKKSLLTTRYNTHFCE